MARLLHSRAVKALLVGAIALVLVLAIAVDEPVDAEPAPAGAAAPTAPAAPGAPPARTPPAPAPTRPAAVGRVIDGDTLVLAGGTIVRLVQIDAPEVRGSECYADEATAALVALLPVGTIVRLEADPALDRVDRYGRRLAYVFADEDNVNETLVREGAASVWFYRGARGRYADRLLAAAEEARAAGRGLWGACEAALDPLSAVSTAPRSAAAAAAADSLEPPAGDGATCQPAYDPCLPVVDDLNCPAVRALGKAPVRVLGSDPYRLDGDRDGVGCE